MNEAGSCDWGRLPGYGCRHAMRPIVRAQKFYDSPPKRPAIRPWMRCFPGQRGEMIDSFNHGAGDPDEWPGKQTFGFRH